ncbi:MAG: hypothetical protein RLZZ336_2184 [Cyanobacteriota bacterium]|jgi:hypothetical protein
MARAETHHRRQEALRLLGEGYGCSELVSKLAEQWGCSRRTARRYVAAAHAALVEDLTPVQASDMLATIVGRLERLARKAEADGQYAAAVGACRSLLDAVVEPNRSHHRPMVKRWT